MKAVLQRVKNAAVTVDGESVGKMCIRDSYNPFAYIRPETREQDIRKFVEVLIKNTSGSEQKGEDF